MAGKFWKEAASLIFINRKKNIDIKSFMPQYNILIMERNANSSFMPSFQAFPGGKLESGDMSNQWIEYIKSSTEFMVHVEKFCKPSMERLPCYENKENLPELSFRLCALRETFEETGLLLINENENKLKIISDATLARKWIPRVQNNPIEFLLLHKDLQCLPAVLHLHEWTSWLTPTTFENKRFDTVFYIAFSESECDLVSGIASTNAEASLIELCCPREKYIDYLQNKCSLAPPQSYEVAKLLRIHDFSELKKFAESRHHFGTSRWLPIVTILNDGFISVLPGDSLYPSEIDLSGEIKKVNKLDMTVSEAFRVKNLNRLHFKNKCFIPYVNFGLENDYLKPVNIETYFEKY